MRRHSIEIKPARYAKISALILLLVLLAGCIQKQLTVTPRVVTIVPPTPLPPQPTAPPIDPNILSRVSQETLFAYMEDLSTIQPYSGWRNSATEGEVEALDYIAGQLGGFTYLEGLGMELERSSFRVYNSTELWETRLHLTTDGQETEVPADGLRGFRYSNYFAIRFDSDGELNDADRDPVIAEGPVILITDEEDLNPLYEGDAAGLILVVDYALVDRYVAGSLQEAVPIANRLLSLNPAGILLVTQFSDELGESHGTFAGDLAVFTYQYIDPDAPVMPILYTRMEDLGPAGIESWEDLEQLETVRLTWDADVFAPGTSGNVVARIPGADPSRAVILGAHIDSPNSPGALDDGSGSVALLEVARVLNEAQEQPPIDLYLSWFGSEEIGLYGSGHFVNTHQELLDRTVAMLQIDMQSRPMTAFIADITFHIWPYSRLGEDPLPLPNYLAQLAAQNGIETVVDDNYDIHSDNANFGGFDVPNVDLSYISPEMRDIGIGYATHIHSPYDTVELARETGDVLEAITQIALLTALQTGDANLDLRVTSPPDHRALFVGSHTEAASMGPAGLTDFGQTLSMAGFDVDLIPYGQAVTPADLETADLVIVLPVIDFPEDDSIAAYDEAWSEVEIDALEQYVDQGGLLVLTHSASRIGSYKWLLDANEDWRDMNDLAERFGVSYQSGTVADSTSWPDGEHPLTEGIPYIESIGHNGRAIEMADGIGLSKNAERVTVGLVAVGSAGGEVLVLADLGMLSSDVETPHNLTFWQNLIRYVQSR